MKKEDWIADKMIDLIILKERLKTMNEREDEMLTEINVLYKIIKNNKREWETLSMDRMSVVEEIDDLDKFFNANHEYKSMLKKVEARR